MDLQTILFWILAALTGLSAIAVVVTQNIVRAAIWLLFTLAGTSGVFFLLGADFVGATQLLVYVGGTLVLVVFGVMLTAQGPFINMKAGAAEWAVALVVGLLLYAALAGSILTRGDLAVAATDGLPKDPETSMTSATLGEAMLGIDRATPPGKVTGARFVTEAEAVQQPAGSGLPKEKERQRVSYLFPFEIVSVHLLVVLVGAAYLARAKRRRGVNA